MDGEIKDDEDVAMWARGRKVSIVLHSVDRGGSGRVAAYLARGFAMHGMQVELLLFCRGGEAEAQAQALAGPDVTLTRLGRLHGARPLDLALGLPALARHLRTERPDVVIAAANNVAVPTAAALRLAGLAEARFFIKTTNPVAGSRHRGPVRLIRRETYRAAFRRATGVWPLSADERDELVAAFPTSAALFREVANPYVTPAMLAAAPVAAAPASGQVIAVARLTRQKRLDRLIRAFAHVRHPGARLLILGEGEERPALAALANSLGLADQVAMPGHVPDVAPALCAADLMVMTSDYEGLPAAVLEAMAANCPVLTTDCFPAARALLSRAEGCGIIADTRPAGLAALIDARLTAPRPTTLRAVAERYSIANGVASHLRAMAGAPAR